MQSSTDLAQLCDHGCVVVWLLYSTRRVLLRAVMEWKTIFESTPAPVQTEWYFAAEGRGTTVSLPLNRGEQEEQHQNHRFCKQTQTPTHQARHNVTMHNSTSPKQSLYPPVPSLSEQPPPPSAPPLAESDHQRYGFLQQHQQHHGAAAQQQTAVQVKSPAAPGQQQRGVLVQTPTIEAQPWVSELLTIQGFPCCRHTLGSCPWLQRLNTLAWICIKQDCQMQQQQQALSLFWWRPM